jgi:kynureninase
MASEFLGLKVDQMEGEISFSNHTTPLDALEYIASRHSVDLLNPALAEFIDAEDPLRALRSEFLFPRHDGEEVVYFVGNSLGLQPRNCSRYIQEELDSWASRGVTGHFEGPKPWLSHDDLLTEKMAKVVGAMTNEVALMNSLTVNLHLLLIRFLNKATTNDFKRTKILIESRSFPSDFYAIESQLRLRGLDPRECIVEVKPREGEHILRTEDIVSEINRHGDDLALVMFSGIQFYTGQLFAVREITKAAHAAGAYAIWDMAHAAGSVNLNLHDWGVDGACWCTYKYLNSGPGGIGGFFIHERHFNKPVDRLLGWWSHDVSTRFDMSNEYQASVGASEFRLSNVPILSSASLLSSLDIFAKTDMQTLRAKSLLLTTYLEYLLLNLRDGISPKYHFEIISGKVRGPQLSLLFSCDEVAKKICSRLEQVGVMIDYRKPGLVRPAPAPLYCNFTDVVRFRDLLAQVISEDEFS